MRRLAAAVVCYVFFVASANTQTNPQAMTLSAVIDCFKEATASGSVENDGSALIFSCSAAKAKILYNFLGSKIRAEVVLDRNGKFENRQFGGAIDVTSFARVGRADTP